MATKKATKRAKPEQSHKAEDQEDEAEDPPKEEEPRPKEKKQKIETRKDAPEEARHEEAEESEAEDTARKEERTADRHSKDIKELKVKKPNIDEKARSARKRVQPEETGEAGDKGKEDGGEDQLKEEHMPKDKKQKTKTKGGEDPGKDTVTVDSDDEKKEADAGTGTFQDMKGPLVSEERFLSKDQEEKATRIMNELTKTHKELNLLNNDDLIKAQRKISQTLKEDEEEDDDNVEDEDKILRLAEEESEDRKAGRGQGRGRGRGKGRARGRGKGHAKGDSAGDKKNDEEPKEESKKDEPGRSRKSSKAKKPRGDAKADPEEKEAEEKEADTSEGENLKAKKRKDQEANNDGSKPKTTQKKAATANEMKSPLKLAARASKRIVNQQKTGESKTGGDDARRRLEFAAEGGNSGAEAEPGTPRKKGKGYVRKTSAEIDTLQHVVFISIPATKNMQVHIFLLNKKPLQTQQSPRKKFYVSWTWRWHLHLVRCFVTPRKCSTA